MITQRAERLLLGEVEGRLHGGGDIKVASDFPHVGMKSGVAGQEPMTGFPCGTAQDGKLCFPGRSVRHR